MVDRTAPARLLLLMAAIASGTPALAAPRHATARRPGVMGTPPTSDEILNLLAETDERHSGDRRTGVPGEQRNMIIRWTRSISGLHCRPDARQSWRCSYLLRLTTSPAASDGVTMFTYNLANMTGGLKPVERRDEYTIVKVGGRWTAPDLDRSLAATYAKRAAQQNASASATSSGCGMYRDYSDLSSLAVRYSYQCHPGMRPDR